MTRDEYEDRMFLRKCADNGGPVNVTQTVAKIAVCGRCGYTVALHTEWAGRTVNLSSIQRGRGRLGLG